MTVLEIESLTQFKEILDTDPVVIVDFYATWCGPCRTSSPAFKELSWQNEDIRFVKVNVDDATDIADEYAIRAIPTFMVFKDGEKSDYITETDTGAMEQLISKYK